jgi:hypothetical protein
VSSAVVRSFQAGERESNLGGDERECSLVRKWTIRVPGEGTVGGLELWGGHVGLSDFATIVALVASHLSACQVVSPKVCLSKTVSRGNVQ